MTQEYVYTVYLFTFTLHATVARLRLRLLPQLEVIPRALNLKA